MKPLWLRDELIKLLYENSEIIAIDKPYGFDSHTNESKAGAGQAEFITPGLIELFEKHLEHKLHIVHRLDRTTTGVLVFAKTADAAKAYRDYFRERKVKKTYAFVQPSKQNPKQERLEFSCDEAILRNGSSLDAKTDFRFAAAADGFARWLAFPKTGRNHQIRIHAARSGLPILGDTKYGGTRFPFLCLHNQKIEFPGGLTIESRPPRYFENLDLLNDAELCRWLFEIDRRERLFQPKASVRLFHERGRALDRFGDRLVLTWPEAPSANDEKFFAKLSEILNEEIDFFLPKGKSLTTARCWVVREGLSRFELRQDGGSTIGLDANQRLQRDEVAREAANAKVLNLFAYTGAFSVVALRGGADEVTSLNTSKQLMEWARANFTLNDLDLSKAKFFLREALTFLGQAKSKGQLFDLVICDAPSFWRSEKRAFKIESVLEELLKGCLEVLKDNGKLLFSTTAETLFVDDIRKAILRVEKELEKGPRKKRRLEIGHIQPSLDFEKPGENPALKSFLITACT